MAIDITVAQYLAATEDFAEEATIVDSGENIASLTPEQFAGLGARNVVAIDASDNKLTISIGQLINLGAVTERHRCRDAFRL